MGLLDSLKAMFGKKDTNAEIPGLPQDMNTVDEIKNKIQDNVSQETVNKITDTIPGEVDDKIADKILGNDTKQ